MVFLQTLKPAARTSAARFRLSRDRGDPYQITHPRWSPCFVEPSCCQIRRLDPKLCRSHVAENELLVHSPIAVDLQQQDGAVSAGTFSRALDVLADTQHLMLRAVEFPLHDPAAKVEFLKIFTRVFGFNGSEGSRTREYREWSADRPLD